MASQHHSVPKTAFIEIGGAKFHEIGYVAKVSGVSTKMIRYYESIGLIPPAKRTQSNYRLYNDHDIRVLCLIKRSRTLGFPLKQIEALLSLWNDPYRTSSTVKQLVLSHIETLNQMIVEMQEMRDTLQHLATACYGNQEPQCPILEDLTQMNNKPPR